MAKAIRKKISTRSKKAVLPKDDPSSDIGADVASISTPVKELLTPYTIFEQCIKRASNLISFHKEGKESEDAEHLLDAYRAAIVLAISALDAFVRSLVAENIKAALVDNTKPLNGKLLDYVKSLLNQETLLEVARKGTLHQQIDICMKADFSTKSFQGEWKINSQMEMIGHKDIFDEISKAANKNKEYLIATLTKFTKRRHTIAHAGDYDLDAIPQTENKIDKRYASDGIEFVREFARHLNDICQKKVKK